MKTKNDFIRGGSSCSFIISKSDLTSSQIKQIFNYEEVATEFGLRYVGEWVITDLKDDIKFYTRTDDFDMLNYLNMIGVGKDKIKDYWVI